MTKQAPTKKTPAKKKTTTGKSGSTSKAGPKKKAVAPAARSRNKATKAPAEPIEPAEVDPGPGLRIAMWSGPRNISTALMRAWDSRPDTTVLDEPFYAHYLKVTRARHPIAEEVIAKGETDWRKVVAYITGPIPRKRPIWYQKHMAHHLLPSIDRSFLGKLTNCFLIRDPMEMLTSLSRTIPVPSVEDTGLPQQVDLFEQLRRETGKTPPVIDARAVLANPEKTLGMLCEAIGVPYHKKMLTWPRGPRPNDGIWGPHWYQSLYETTRFNSYKPRNEPMTTAQQRVYKLCCGPYQKLFGYRLR